MSILKAGIKSAVKKGIKRDPKTVAKKIIICNGLTTGCLNDKNLKSFLHKNNIKIVFYEIINKIPRLKKFTN